MKGISTLLLLLCLSASAQDFNFQTEFTKISIWYNNGTFVTFQTGLNDLEINKFISSIDNYLATGDHCYLNTRSCDFRFKNTKKGFNNKTIEETYYHLINFDSVSVIQVSKNNKPPENCNYASHGCSVFVANDGFNVVINFDASWSYVLSNIEFGFAKITQDFKNMKGGTQIDQKKWEFRSECTKNYTALYIMDFSKAMHLQTMTSYQKN